MPEPLDLKELAERTMDLAPAQDDALERQLRTQRRHAARRRTGGLAVAALIVAIVAFAAGRAVQDRPSTEPLTRSDPWAIDDLPLLKSGSYLLNVRDGEVTPFELEPGWAFAPSPTDPERYAFSAPDQTGRAQLWVVEAGGEPRKLTSLPNVSAAVWSPDGRWLAFGGAGGPAQQVHVADPNSGWDAAITDEPTGAFAPTWSPDGRTLVYAAKRQGEEIDGLPFLPEYWVLRSVEVREEGGRLVAGEPVDLFGSDQESATTPNFSPDGRTIAYAQTDGLTSNMGLPSSLRLLDLETGTTTELVRPLHGLADPRWSPDGRTISFMVMGSEGWEAWAVDVATGSTARLSRGYPFTWEDADHVHLDV